jgi:CMP-N-acetylneuraminic acid synthetase
MTQKNKIIALIPLRGGSKSIPKKNIKLIHGKPLCAWVLEAAINSRMIDDVYVSTDSKEIINVVTSLEMGVKIIERPSEFATDIATTESVMLHVMENVSFDTIITIQATSPLLQSKQIDSALQEFERLQFDSMLSATRVKNFFWNDDGLPLNYDPLMRPMRQNFKGTFMENGAFYITKKKVLKSYNCRVGGNVGIFEMGEDAAIEIDEPEDWIVVEELLKKTYLNNK